MNPPLDYESQVRAYRNTTEGNDAAFAAFTAATAADPLLAAHRAHVEANQLGFGEPAFHALWASLVSAASARFGRVRALEIGVFKGQVISLWSLLARELPADLEIHALTPLAGNPPPRPGLWQRLRYRLDANYREEVKTGNFYAEEDYEAIGRAHFARHGLSFDAVRLHRGYSTDPALLARLSAARYELIYVDGDHREAGARHDFATFGAKVVPGGWLVADDAGHDLPGETFWKGYPEVTTALSELAPLGFVNVLNVGHNRVFQRRSD
jgi:hypothetical protein